MPTSIEAMNPNVTCITINSLNVNVMYKVKVANTMTTNAMNSRLSVIECCLLTLSKMLSID